MRIRSIFKEESGIALLLVISSLVVLMMITTEFAYNAQIEYKLALRQKQRTQAYYLAMSAYQLTRLQLKINDAVQKQIQKGIELMSQQGVELPLDPSTPICEQFPMQSAFFRLAAAASTPAEGEEASEESASLLAGVSLQGVEEFLKFDGDFGAECSDESAKIQLNYFYDQDPRKQVIGDENPYDSYKKLIMKTLQNPSYQKLFEASQLTPEEATRHIADWVDPNSTINEWGGAERGGEDSEYRNVTAGETVTKNGKFSTPLDIYRVASVEESWWGPLADLFTIYGSSSKEGSGRVNVCRAPNEVVRGLILRYIERRKDLPPMEEENKEIIDQLIESVQESCVGGKPDENEIAQNLDSKIAELLKVEAPRQPEQPAGPGPEEPEKPEESEEGGETGEGGKNPTNVGGSLFADWITTETRFYKLRLTGQVDDSIVRIETAIDVGEKKGQDPKEWKTLYWKVY